MSKAGKGRLYRVTFHNQGKVYEVYAREVSQGGLFGFVEIADLVFGEKSGLLVDPTEDALRQEFGETKRVYLPLHSIIRIDEQEKSSSASARIVPLPTRSGKEGGPGSGPPTPIYTPTNPFQPGN